MMKSKKMLVYGHKFMLKTSMLTNSLMVVAVNEVQNIKQPWNLTIGEMRYPRRFIATGI